MTKERKNYIHPFFNPYSDLSAEESIKKVFEKLGKNKLLEAFRKMLLIRHFETRAESAYQQGKIGGFFHSYTGQEAIQTSVFEIFGMDHWYIGFYRCHALALLLGATPDELMAELYGRSTGNAKGRGGSMHLYTSNMLGGFAIVGGQIPIAAGAAFSIKYLNQKEKFAICFLGEAAVAQGTFHETLNLVSLWNLPCIFIIENNQWGMGTHVSSALATEPVAESQAPSYGMKAYTLNGMDFFSSYTGFSYIYEEALKTRRPILVECICERFKGHSVSDPGLYRTKEELEQGMQKDPISAMRKNLEDLGILDEATYKKISQEEKEKVLRAMDFAEKSPWPSPSTLEEGVFAP